MSVDRRDFGECEELPDGIHCTCWWDGDPCCSCDHNVSLMDDQFFDDPGAP